MEGNLTLRGGEITCAACPAPSVAGAIRIDEALARRLPLFENTEAYKSARFSPAEEIALLKLFGAHLDGVLDKDEAVRSLKVFCSLVG
jgi:hypothetical protein